MPQPMPSEGAKLLPGVSMGHNAQLHLCGPPLAYARTNPLMTTADDGAGPCGVLGDAVVTRAIAR